jgi:oligopeptide/dipeptide ABC transporter ATP-binding protein
LSVVRHIADRIAVMYLGKIMETGDAKTVFENPRHPYTMALISASPSFLDGKGGAIAMDGEIPSPLSPPKRCPFASRCFMAQDKCHHVPAPVVCVGEGHDVACHFAEVDTDEKRALAYQNRATNKA